MQRYKLTIEYDGTPYCGWQRQENQPSVQQVLERAIEAFSHQSVTVFGAGRTDAGVHALAQNAHVDMEDAWDSFKFCNAINAHLRGQTIAVLGVEQVGDDFDARFSALARHYFYRIVTRRAPLAVEAGRVWNVKVPLDVAAMNAAAQQLLGKHDFTTFRSSECQAKSPVKTLSKIEVSCTDKIDGQHIEIRISARSFLHNQVRSIVGSLKCIGDGKWSTDDLVAALEACDRKKCGPVAPAHGLYLARVEY